MQLECSIELSECKWVTFELSYFFRVSALNTCFWALNFKTDFFRRDCYEWESRHATFSWRVSSYCQKAIIKSHICLRMITLQNSFSLTLFRSLFCHAGAAKFFSIIFIACDSTTLCYLRFQMRSSPSFSVLQTYIHTKNWTCVHLKWQR